MKLLTVSDVARQIGAKPKDISGAFYARHLDDKLCPIVGGRRLIPLDYAPVIAETMRRLGRLEIAHAG